MNEYPKEYLFNMTENGLAHWLNVSRLDLAGGALFTTNNSAISRLVRFVTKGESKLKGFIPSHVGSIILLDGVLYVFNMIPPKAYIQRLDDYLATTEDNFVILSRDFDLDIIEFSRDMFNRIGEKYGYISAAQSAFKWWTYNRREHCSEIHTLELQKQGYLKDLDANETTPVELYEKLLTEDIARDDSKENKAITLYS